MKNTRLIGILALIALVLMVFAGCEGTETVEEKEVPKFPSKGFAAQVTYGTANHCGLAFVQDGVFNEAFIPNEWATLSTADQASFTTNYLLGTNKPKYIVITLDGEATLYEGKLTAVDTATGGYSVPASGGVTRYFKVTALSTDTSSPVVPTSTAAQTNANSFEYSLNSQAKAKSYIAALKALEVTGTANVDTSGFVKYVKEFAPSASTVTAALGTGATLLDTERLNYGATRGTATAVATKTTGKVAIGAGAASMDQLPNATNFESNGGAYATTFFKLGSTYGGRFKFAPKPFDADTAVVIGNNTVEDTYKTMQDYLQPVAAALKAKNVFPGDITLVKTSQKSDKLHVDGTDSATDVVTGATAANTAVYTGLFIYAL